MLYILSTKDIPCYYQITSFIPGIRISESSDIFEAVTYLFCASSAINLRTGVVTEG